MYLPTKDTAKLTDCLLFRPGLTDVLGIRIRMTTEMPPHYEREPIVVEAELRNLTLKPERFPVYKFIVDETAEANMPLMALLSQVQQDERDYYNTHTDGLRDIVRKRANLNSGMILKFTAGDWVVALHDQVTLWTSRLMFTALPLGTITTLEIVK